MRESAERMPTKPPTKPPTLRRRTALLGALALPLAACTPLAIARRTPPTLHRLTPKTTFPDDLPDLGPRRVMVEPPTAASGLNTARIALKPDPFLLDYFADTMWIEVVPIMVQTLVTESLDASGSLDVLGPDAIGLRPDYILRIHIREFQAEYDNGLNRPPLVNVRLQVRLLGMPRRESLATVSIQQFARAEGTPLDQIVFAFDEALGRVLRRVVQWTLEEIVRADRG